MGGTPSLAVLVLSCDRYADLWNPFFETFSRFWPDCPFPVYLIANHREFSSSRVHTLTTGDDESWSANLRKALLAIPEDYVLLTLEDILFYRRVPTARVLEAFDWACHREANCLRLNPQPPPAKPYEGGEFGPLPKGAIYRASTVLTIWKRDVLLALLRTPETAWEFEVHATVRSDNFDRFYGTSRKLFHFTNGVVKGKWFPPATAALARLNIQRDPTRAVMNLRESLVYRLRVLRWHGLMLFPSRYRRIIKDWAIRARYECFK